MVSTVHSGETSPEDCNRVWFCSTTLCQGWPDGGGREAQHSTLRTNSAPTSCLNLSSTSRLCSVPRAVLSQGSRSFAPPSLRRPDLNPSSSVCCFSDASGVLYPCVLQAGAAVHSIPVATTAQLARMQGFWDGGGSRWRAQQHAFVEKPEHAFRLMFVCRTWTSLRVTRMVADGLPLFHGAQLAIDTTLVSPLSRNGAAKRQCAGTDGAAMVQARRRKERTYPELAQVHGRARLVVLACEVGGRWSAESLRFLHLVAEAKVRDEPEEFRDLVKKGMDDKVVFVVGVHSSKSSCPFLVGAQMRSRLRWRGAIHFRSGP